MAARLLLIHYGLRYAARASPVVATDGGDRLATGLNAVMRLFFCCLLCGGWCNFLSPFRDINLFATRKDQLCIVRALARRRHSEVTACSTNAIRMRSAPNGLAKTAWLP